MSNEEAWLFGKPCRCSGTAVHSTVSAVLYHCDRFYSVSATDGMGSLWMDFCRSAPRIESYLMHAELGCVCFGVGSGHEK